MSNIKRICFLSAALTLFVAAAPAAAHDGFRRPWEARPYAPRAHVYQPPIVYRPPPVYYRPWTTYGPERRHSRPLHPPYRRYW
jgi:hypothetical protein